MPRITPMLWFDHQANEAAKFYCAIFPNSKITETTELVTAFVLDGEPFTALNGGPQFTFTEAISLVIECHDQKEVDYYWSKLTAGGGSESMCGWLKDKYGLSWQVTPVQLLKAVNDPDKAKAKRAFDAMLKMRKIDIAAIEKAAKG